MKFGVLYIPDYYEERHKSSSHYYGEMLEQIDLCEEIGMDSIWFAEHYVGGYAFPSPPIFAAAVAQRTKRVRFGTAVTLLPLTNPIKTAEEYAMLDVLSDGRLDFGIGRGILRHEYDLFGINPDESQGRYHEALDVILQAWTQDDGHVYRRLLYRRSCQNPAQAGSATPPARLGGCRGLSRVVSSGRVSGAITSCSSHSPIQPSARSASGSICIARP